VPKKKNIGFIRATANASREGDKEPPENAKKLFPKGKTNMLRGDLTPGMSDKDLGR
jgi:hypothetical protein